MKRDVVLSCFATASQETVNAIKQGPKGLDYFQPLDGFTDPPLVISVPYSLQANEGNVSPAYSRQAQKYKNSGNGSIIRGALSELAPGVEARTVSLSCFSGGQAFAKEVIKNGEGKYVDTIMMLDGLHLSAANVGQKTDGIQAEWAPWVEYAKDAWGGEKLLVLLHTNITIPSPYALSTTESARLVTDKLESVHLSDVHGTFRLEDFHNAVNDSTPPPSVSIWSPIAKPDTKNWDSFPWKLVQVAGNYIDLDIGGSTPQDHIFAATYGQRLVWRHYYRARMNQAEKLCSPTSGVGSFGLRKAVGEEPGWCRKNLTILPPDMQGGLARPSLDYSGSDKVFWFLAGIGAGVGAGVLMKRFRS